MSAMLLLAALIQGAAAEPGYEARPFADALQDFERLCVAPLPSPIAFTEAMRYRTMTRTPREAAE